MIEGSLSPQPNALGFVLGGFPVIGLSVQRAVRNLFCVSLLLTLGAATASAQDVSASPSSLSFPNTYVGLASGSKTVTVTDLLSPQSIIQDVAFSCPGEFGLSSGVAPITLSPVGDITHYSIFFKPTVAGTYNCNFEINLWDKTTVNVPVSGTALTSSATTTVTPSSLSFGNLKVGTSSAAQNVTVKNTGTQSVNITAITFSPPSFSLGGTITLPYVLNQSASLVIPVIYSPSLVTSETGVVDISYNSLPDNGADLTGAGIKATTTEIVNNAVLPQATQSAAYEATLTATGTKGPFTWALASGSSLPSGLTLSSAGSISGTLASSVAVGTYSFTATVTDTKKNTTASKTFSITVYSNLKDNCADLSYDVPGTSTPMTALTDLGTGTYQGSEGGLYPNGSNVRPSGQDSAGVSLAQGIQPLDSNGVYSPTGNYVLMALGESTLQNEWNFLAPIANSDPAKNPYLVLVNAAQGGATPNEFANINSYYWGMITNNYLTQNNVTANQVVAVYIEDTDGIASGTFPSDITSLQSEYETIMNNLHTLFPNLKLVYFSSRVYGGYSNGVGNPDNPEPYAFEVGYAVKWAIQDQLNGNSNLNYNPLLGPVLAPWMSWGAYYWSNGMLGRNDGLVWDCADFNADGTHPSSDNNRVGQYKVAYEILNFLKSDDTTTPWYLATTLGLSATAGNNQSAAPGTQLPTALTVLATNLQTGAPVQGVKVTFTDNGAGGTFSATTATTNSSGNASTEYTLPPTPATVTITATATGYAPATFTETGVSTVATIGLVSGGKQSGTVGTTLPNQIVFKAEDSSKNIVVGAPITFTDGSSGGTFSPNPATTGSNGEASTTYTLPTVAKPITVTASNGSVTGTASETSVAGPANTLAIVSGNNQSANPKTLLPKKLVVSVTDQYNNGISGEVVTFSDNGAGGTFSSTTATTVASGQASVTYTTGANAGTVTISTTTTSPKLGPTNFTETVK
jgi:hypothetical protein